MSKLTSARAGIPVGKPGTPPRPLRGPAKTLQPAALVFLEHGAKAAHKYLGGGNRAKLMMPAVFLRAKYLVRQAKRLGAG